jgi:hypothetical protein
VGDEVAFQVNYSTLLRAMTSPFVAKVVTNGTTSSNGRSSPEVGLVSPRA